MPLLPQIPILALSGTLVLVGYLGDLDPMLNSAPLILGRKSVAGSVIGGIEEMQEMIDFCAKHQITSDIEPVRQTRHHGLMPAAGPRVLDATRRVFLPERWRSVLPRCRTPVR